MSVHLEELQEYRQDVHIIVLSQQEYPNWDKHKGVNGFKSIRVLHDPTKLRKLKAKKMKVEAVEAEDSPKMKVTYLEKEEYFTRDELKEVLSKHEIKYFKGSSTEKLIELVEDITSEE